MSQDVHKFSAPAEHASAISKVDMERFLEKQLSFESGYTQRDPPRRKRTA